MSTQKIEIENVFMRDAKSIVDMLFETKFFYEKITRDDMNEIEKFVGELMSMKFEGYLRSQKLFERIKNIKP